jgi:hypothetical protein
MPSETQDKDLHAALAIPLESFRSALASALDQVRGTLEQQRAGPDGNHDTASVALGRFAAGRIDADRFTSLLARNETLDAPALARVERAHAVLHELDSAGEAPYRVVVEPGQDLVTRVDEALASIGRAFGAARVYELSRTSAYREPDHAGLLDRFPFERWNRAERALAPTLLVHVHGRDLFADGLARYLDGSLKILLVVEGDAPRAPLVRLVSPGTYVVQAGTLDDLGGLLRFPGPGVGAILPDSSAWFVNDPARGGSPWDRLKLLHVPETAPPPRLGGRTAFQQTEEMRQLAALATPPPEPEPAPAPAAPAAPAQPEAEAAAATPPAGDPADQLAAWLLSQANLENLAPE